MSVKGSEGSSSITKKFNNYNKISKNTFKDGNFTESEVGRINTNKNKHDYISEASTIKKLVNEMNETQQAQNSHITDLVNSEEKRVVITSHKYWEDQRDKKYFVNIVRLSFSFILLSLKKTILLKKKKLVVSTMIMQASSQRKLF